MQFQEQFHFICVYKKVVYNVNLLKKLNNNK